MRKFIGLCAISTIFLASNAFAQAAETNTHENVVSSQIRSAEVAYWSLGYNRVLQVGSHSLNKDAKATYDFDVVSGKSYAILGACDSDCSDLDMRVLRPDGSEAIKDDKTDDLPAIAFTANSTGRYKLEISMYACSTNPCFYNATIVSNAPAAAASDSNSSNTNYDGQVSAQLDRFEEVAVGQNFRRLFRSPMLHMNKDAVENYTVTLTRGINYKIGGVCDNDCPDMDIKLLDPSGREVASDVLTDSVPIIDFKPTQGGAYTVRAIMYNCTSNPCSAGLTVMVGR